METLSPKIYRSMLLSIGEWPKRLIFTNHFDRFPLANLCFFRYLYPTENLYPLDFETQSHLLNQMVSLGRPNV